MFEIIIFAYMALHACYILFAKRRIVADEIKDDFLYMLGKQIAEALPKEIRHRLVSNEETIMLSHLHPQKHLKQASEIYISKKVGLIYLILTLGGFFALILGNDHIPASEVPTIILRPELGEAPKQLNLTYSVEGEEGPVTGNVALTVDPRLPESDEALSILESKFEPIIEAMLAPQDQQNHVLKDLIFERQPFKEPIEVGYASLTPDYLTDKGQLRSNQMDLNEPYHLSVLVTMTLSGLQIQNTYDFVAYRAPMSISDEVEMIDERIEVREDLVILPEDMMENEGHFQWMTRGVGIRGIQIFAVSVLMGVIAFFFRKETLNKALEERQQMILNDFPDMVSKLAILMNAGMTFSPAWHKVVMDYQERSVMKRPLYEEMLITTTQIQNGMAEKEALGDFGRRTGSKEVIRLSGVLIQNLRRGSHSLTEALKQLSTEAWDIRTNNAKMLGEKASTKLMLPMAISFMTVIIIVLAPTLMSMNL